MDTLRLLITDSSLLLSEKGKPLFEKTFETDDECFSLISSALSGRKNSRNDHIECLFAGSRLIIESRHVEYAEKKGFEADQKTVRLLLDNASHVFLDTHKDQKLDIVQEEVMEIYQNGYPVREVKKQQINELRISVFFAALPAEYRKKFMTALGNLSSRATFGSFGWHQSKRVFDLTKKEGYMICSVYEQSTGLSIRKKGGYFETATVSFGTHHADEQAQKGLQPEWFQASIDEAIGKVLTKVCNGTSLPPTVYLMVATPFKKQFENAFRSDSYHSMCFSDSGFEVVDMSSILKA